MKRLLAVGLTLAFVLGLVAGASAFEADRLAVSANQMQVMEQSLGGMHPKDECWIWMDNLAGWVWIWTVGDMTGCGLATYVDPELGYTDCLPPYFPFNIESLKIGIHAYDFVGPGNYDVVLEYTINEVAPSAHPCGFEPGAEIWHSNPILWSLPPGWLGFANLTLPSVWVDGPFFVTYMVMENYGDGSSFGWLTDNTAYGTTPCWHWLFYGCGGYAMWLEFYGDLGITDGNTLFGVDGRPQWNVAVDMGSFEVVAGDARVTLNWQSMSETNNQSWTVKRDGEAIASIAGQGTKETSTDYVFVDKGLTNGVTYSYTIEAVNYEGNIDAYGPVTATPFAGSVPGVFALSQNYPNPFNASTVIRYQLASDEYVSLKVYNIYGQEVASLVNADQKAGQYTVQWNGKEVSSGVYFYTLTAGDFSQTNKMVFTK